MISSFMLITFEADNSETFELLDVPSGSDEPIVYTHVPPSDFRLCEPLQHFIEELRIITDKLPKDDIRFIYRQSIETFITEANKHREYCNAYLLRYFSDAIYEALVPGFSEMNGDLSNNPSYRNQCEWKERAITPSELKYFSKIANSPASDTDNYLCCSDEKPFMIMQLIYATLLHYFKRGYIVGVCQNCGKVFITENKSNEKYCKRKSPQDSSKTCAQYMKYEKQKIHNSTDTKKEYNRILRRLSFTESEIFRSGYTAIPPGDKSKRAEYVKMWAEKYPRRK